MKGVISITQDHFADFVFYALFGVRRDLWPVGHAFNWKRANKEDPHFIGEIVYNWGLWFAPGANHINVAVFDKREFFFEQVEVSWIRQGMRVKGFIEGGFENDFFTVEVKVFASDGEFPEAKASFFTV